MAGGDIVLGGCGRLSQHLRRRDGPDLTAARDDRLESTRSFGFASFRELVIWLLALVRRFSSPGDPKVVPTG